VQRLVVHPPDHEHLAGVELLSNRWHQAMGIATKTFGDPRVEVGRDARRA
jgi:hypothetical protein